LQFFDRQGAHYAKFYEQFNPKFPPGYGSKNRVKKYAPVPEKLHAK
jgi:hypothetical protein